ncbi:MAG: Arsenical resistance operon repressor, partial [uncultured Nocardioides sp.]
VRDCSIHRHLSISTCVEVPADPHPDRDGRVLLAADARAAVGRPGRAARSAPQGARRPGPPAPGLDGGGQRGRRGLRLRPQRRLRPLAAHDQPPPQGAPRGRPARPVQARRLGLLRRTPRGARRRRRPPRRGGV